MSRRPSRPSKAAMQKSLARAEAARAPHKQAESDGYYHASLGMAPQLPGNLLLRLSYLRGYREAEQHNGWGGAK